MQKKERERERERKKNDRKTDNTQWERNEKNIERISEFY